MPNFDDSYREFKINYCVKIVKDLAQYLCDRFPQNYSNLVVEVCKMYCNQKFDTKFDIDSAIAQLPWILKLEGGC